MCFRLAGPATTVTVHCPVPPRVEVRTLWEAVSEIGERLARLVLTPGQLDILTRAPDMVCLVGPPGTGKTVVLVMVGLQWLRQGHDVHVVCTLYECIAVCRLIYHQLTMTLRADPTTPPTAGTVHFHLFDLLYSGDREVGRAVTTLVAASRGQQLHVLIDEATFSTFVRHYASMFTPFHNCENVLLPLTPSQSRKLSLLCFAKFTITKRKDNFPTILYIFNFF